MDTTPIYSDPSQAEGGSPELPGGDSLGLLDQSNVLILVNADSPAGLEVVKLYREFHSGIVDAQVVYLSGLADSASLTSTPADEILTRSQFETLIAEPTRAYLVAHDLVDSTYVIITTAGMPYRIEDSDPSLSAVISPAASNATIVINNLPSVDAASVESELSVLFQIDPAIAGDGQMSVQNRLVNPYQGYESGIKDWDLDRDIKGERESLRWTWAWRVYRSPIFEGAFSSGGYTSSQRIMSPASIYLTARLDGPRNQGEYPVFAVRKMLARAAAVSDISYSHFVGHFMLKSSVVIDHAPTAAGSFQYGQTYNVPSSVTWLTQEDQPMPPGSETFDPPWQEGDHYINTYEQLCGYSPPAGNISAYWSTAGLGSQVYYDGTSGIMNQSLLDSQEGLLALLTFGKNSGDGRPKTFLKTGGPDGGALFECVPGAIYSSLESFNAVTMFSDAVTNQSKIGDFIEIGGTAAAGHCFEPEASAAIQGDYVIRNYLRDANNDGVGDLTAVEAMFTGLPYLSWSEVFVGDPLTRLRWGMGGKVDLTPRPGDIDGDGFVGFNDVMLVMASFDTLIGQEDYWVPADCTEDGVVDGVDMTLVLDYYGTDYTGQP